MNKAIHDISFGAVGSHTIPTPSKLDVNKLIPDFQEWPDMNEYCALYNSPLRMLAFPFRQSLNDFMCPTARYLYGTSLYPVYSFFFGFTYYDPTPYPGNNCAPENLATFCFVLKLGHFILPYVVVFVIVVTFLPPFFPAIRDAFELAWVLCEKVLHILFWGCVRVVRPKHAISKLTLQQYINMVQ
jgi:hypothetical protein